MLSWSPSLFMRELETVDVAPGSSFARFRPDSGVVVPVEAEYAESVWHLYVVRVADRDGLRAHLADDRIATGIHYPIPIHLQPAYRDIGYGRGDFPIAEAYAGQILSLPMYPELTPTTIEHIAQAIRDFQVQTDPDRNGRHHP